MGNREVRAHASNNKGDQLAISAHETDSPLLPVAQLERLHNLDPKYVDFVVEQTRIEADHRRTQVARNNKFIFIEHMLGMVLAGLMGLAGIAGGVYLGLNGQAWLGGAVVSAALVTLAVAFLRNRPR